MSCHPTADLIRKPRRTAVTLHPSDADATMQQLNQYLDPKLVKKSGEWQRIKDLLVLALPPDVMKKVVYASLEDTTLTVFCESPAWSSKLRFYDAEVRKVLSKNGTVIRAVTARSMPPVTPRP